MPAHAPPQQPPQQAAADAAGVLASLARQAPPPPQRLCRLLVRTRSLGAAAERLQVGLPAGGTAGAAVLLLASCQLPRLLQLSPHLPLWQPLACPASPCGQRDAPPTPSKPTVSRSQALGQPFERLQLAGAEDPTVAAEALAVADADGWRFCFVGGGAQQGGGDDAAVGMEE